MKRWRGAILALGVLAYLGGTLAWLRSERTLVAPKLFPAGSVHNTDSRGLSLAYGYLRERAGAGRVEALTRPLEPISVTAGAVVFRVRPPQRFAPRTQRAPEQAQAPAAELITHGEEAFVREGGRLVLGVAEAYGPFSVTLLGGGVVRKVFPSWPGVDSLRPEPRRALSGRGLQEAHAIFAAASDPLFARIAIGKGDLIVTAAPELFENRLLGEADHLALLVALAGAGRAVYFDERAHGAAEETGLFYLLAAWGFGPTLVLSGLAGALAFWRARARVGPEEDEHRETRSEAVDLVDSLGRLYDRTLTRDEALWLYAQAFERAVQARAGLRGEPLRERVKQLLGGVPTRPRAGQRDLQPLDFSRRLKTLNDAYRRLLDARTR